VDIPRAGGLLKIAKSVIARKELSPYGPQRLAEGILQTTLIYSAGFLEPAKTMINKVQIFCNRVSQ